MEGLATSGGTPVALRLFVLGGFRAERGGQIVPDAAWQRRSAKALVKLLAVAPRHRLHREQIMEALWPEQAPESATNSFRKALHLARHALEPTMPTRGSPTYLRLANDLLLLGDAVWIDADAFQSLAERAFTDPDRARYEAALTAYTGELLPEDRYEDWARPRQETLAGQHQRLLLGLATLLEQAGEHGGAVERLLQVLTADPTQEEAHRRLMRVYASGGSRHQALRQYQVCRDVLRQELATVPDQTTDALYQALLTGRPLADTGRPGVRSRPALPEAVRHPPPGPLVGRERALSALLGHLAQSRAGAGSTILVGGEAGVGKSRLASEVAREAAGRGALVLWGASYQQEGQLPYGPFVEAIEAYLADRPAAERRRFAVTYPELTALIAALVPATAPTPPATDLETERARLFAAVARWFEALSAAQPLVLVLDDLHTADAASVQLLHYLARVAPRHRWLLLGTYREEDLVPGSTFQQLCATATRAGLCHRLDLLRLARQDCDRLIDSLLPGGSADPPLLERLYMLSLGNPLFARELVSALREQSGIDQQDGRWRVADEQAIGVPLQVRALVASRIDRLGEDARRALALAAVAGMHTAFAVLRAASDLPEGPLLDALDLALAAQVLEERGDGYAFRHPLFRAALYDRLSRPRRAQLHAALARALEGPGVGASDGPPEMVEALAHHWTEAGEPARAVPYLVRAGEHAARLYANVEAVARFRQALALLEGTGASVPDRQAHRAALGERLGDLHALGGETPAAWVAYTEALAAGRSLIDWETVTAARLRRKAARQALLNGDLTAAHDLLAEASALLDGATVAPDRDLERTRLLAVSAHEHWLAYRFPEALAAAEESAALAERLGAAEEQARAYEMMALACLPLGDWQRGLECERRRASLTDLNRDVTEAADVHV